MAERIIIEAGGSPSEFQEYSSTDLKLVQQTNLSVEFGAAEDYIEYYIYDLNGELLFSNSDSKNYTLSPTGINPSTGTSTVVNISPEQDIKQFGIDRGSVRVVYNFYKKILGSNQGTPFWIKEISPDRTELKVSNQFLSTDQLTQVFTNYQSLSNTQPYLSDFLLNFGENRAIIGVNLAFTVDLDSDAVLLVKLYDSLPEDFDIKDTFWFVEKLTEPTEYTVTIEVDVPQQPPAPSLRGPNFNIKLKEQAGQTLEQYSYNDLFSSQVSSSYQQLKSLLEEKGIEINVDYTDFSQFIHFSSATDRLYNFKYKLQLIESYSADIRALSTITNNTVIKTNTSEVLQKKIDTLVEKFDGYEYYLYFESGAFAWPKYNNNAKPYTLYSVTSSQAINWLGNPESKSPSILYSASYYDQHNKDLFVNTLPAYLRDDTSNLPYETFLNMVGQHFDNIWIYLKDVTQRYVANNSLSKGISKDLVANALKGLGINLYTNTNISNNTYYSLLGYNADTSQLPPTGSELISNYITSSLSTVAAEDITLEYYKRIYHNLPYLLKTKGTERGLRALISCFGIPDTLLSINEYGGVVKESDYAGYRQSRFSLAYENDHTSSIVFPWAPSYYQYLNTGDTTLVPDGIEFRFKTKGIPSFGFYSQSLFQVGAGANFQFGANLVYTPNIDTFGSTYQNYGYLTLYIDGSGAPLKSTPIHLPFFDSEQWWNVLIKRETGSLGATSTSNNRYWVYVKSSFFNEEGISRVGFEGSSSIFVNGGSQSTYNNSWLSYNASAVTSFNAYLGGTTSNTVLSPDNCNFNGYFQEFRYWINDVPESAFDKHVLNSRDYSLNNPTASQFNLIFRAPLGNNLTVPYLSANGSQLNQKDYDLYLLGLTNIDVNSVVDTVHPAVTGSYYIPNYGAVVVNIPSFVNGGTTYGYGLFSTNNNRSFVEQTFTDLVTSAVTGISQKINNKVIIETTSTSSLASLNVLNPYVSLQNYSTNRTISSPQLEVAYSPADVIDEDILNQLGGFNIDDYIGNPTHLYTPTYPDLEELKQQYFSKYLRRFNLYDFIRLLKYIDNSLFKMIKDFTPARANLSTGVVVKSHILERPKYPRHEPSFSRHEYSGSINTAFIEGTTPESVNYQTSYSQSYRTPSGSIPKFVPNYLAQYTGEFSGSTIDTATGNFPQFDVSNVIPINTESLSVNRPSWAYVTYSLDPLLNNVTQSRESRKFYDADYSYNVVLPVNFNAITYSIDQAQANNPQYNNINTPWAQLQDSNYTSKTFTTIRYDGSKTQSKLYSTYSLGDSSYGKTAAIDKIRFQYAYLRDIYTASLALPSRSNAQIKYLIDDEEFVLDLTKENNNIFDVQNIYKGGETVNISLFDYTNQSTNRLANRNIEIYEGGFRYLPIYHNILGDPNAQLIWNLEQPIQITVTVPSAGGGTSAGCSSLGDPAWWQDSNYWRITTQVVSETQFIITSVQYVGPQVVGTTSILPTCPSDFIFTLKVGMRKRVAEGSNWCYRNTGANEWVEVATYQIPYSTNPVSTAQFSVRCSCDDFQDCGASGVAGETYVVPQSITVGPNPAITPASQTTTITQYTTRLVDNAPCIFFPATSSQPEYSNRLIQFSQTASFIALNQAPAVFNSYSDGVQGPPTATGWWPTGMEPAVLPFSFSTGDGIHFFTSSIGWAEQEEYRIVETFASGTAGVGLGVLYYAVLDRNINPFLFLQPNSTPPSGPNPGKICKFIAVKHVPDETNVILRYNPLDPELVEEGILYPQYILESVRKSAGNVIKSLKSQGLI